MTRSLIIIGCGGFGREVFSIVRALQDTGSNWKIEGFADDAPADRDLQQIARLESRMLGSVDHIASFGAINAIIAIGSPKSRKSVSDRLLGTSVEWATLIHPQSTIGLNVRIGEGTVIAAGARLSTNIDIGRHVQIDQNATIGHDSVLCDFARLNPQACVSGSAHISEAATIGAGATVLQGIRVGESALVGASACVTRDVACSSIVKGVPARRSPI